MNEFQNNAFEDGKIIDFSNQSGIKKSNISNSYALF